MAQFDPKILGSLAGLQFKARYVMEGFLSGLHSSPFHGFSVEFSEYREYQPGDDPRFIDWRLYARNDRLCVKRFEQETNVRLYILCDTSASMAYRGKDAWASKFEAAQILATAITWMFLKQNDAVGLLGGRPPGKNEPKDSIQLDYVAPSQRPSQMGELMRHMGTIQPSGGALLSRLLETAQRLMHRRSVVLLFSDLLEPSEELERSLKQFRFDGHECVVFQVLDKDEIEFPFGEDKILEDLETGTRREVQPELIRGKYLERFNAFMDAHRRQFRSLEMQHCIVRTDHDPGHALATIINERRRLK